jgi:hypothetical protein
MSSAGLAKVPLHYLTLAYPVLNSAEKPQKLRYIHLYSVTVRQEAETRPGELVDEIRVNFDSMNLNHPTRCFIVHPSLYWLEKKKKVSWKDRTIGRYDNRANVSSAITLGFSIYVCSL